MPNAFQNEDGVRQRAIEPVKNEMRHLGFDAGAYLYHQGEPRRGIFKVEAGTIAISHHRTGRPNRIVHLAGPGDYIGLGFLDCYAESAQAVVASLVVPLTPDQFRQLADVDKTLREQQAEAISREFEFRKLELTINGPSTPVECLASFLICVSRQNSQEGRNPAVITDSFKCGAIAELLGIDLDALAAALVDLKRRNVIEECDLGQLHLVDIAAIEVISEGRTPEASPIEIA